MSNVNTNDLAYVLPSAKTPGLAGRFVKAGCNTKQERVFVAAMGASFEVPAHAFVENSWSCTAATTDATLPWLVGPDTVVEMINRPIADALLKRVDGPEGTDEMLRITGLPNKQGEKV